MRILVVEDDDRIARALAEALTDRHYVVDMAFNGQQGWEFALSVPYDLIVWNL